MRRNQQMKSPPRSSGGGVLLLRRSTRMASILNLIRPEAAFDPDTIALCARYARGGGAADYR